MALLSKVGLGRGRSLMVLLTIYAVLLLGTLTMLIPFLMTLTTSVTNAYDLPQYNMVPRFLYDDDELFIKYLVEKYPSYDYIKKQYRISGADTMTELSLAKDPLKNNFAPLDYDTWDPAKLVVARKDWDDYWEKIRHDHQEVLLVERYYPYETLDAFHRFLRDKYVARWSAEHPTEARQWKQETQEKAAVALMNQTYGSVAGTEFARVAFYPGGGGRLWAAEQTPRFLDCVDFLATLPSSSVFLLSPEFDFQDALKEQYVTLEKLNAAWGTQFKHWAEILFVDQPPKQPAQLEVWAKFVTGRMPARRVRLERPPSNAEFQSWMVKRYGSLEHLNVSLKTQFRSMAEVAFSPELPQQRNLRFAWIEFATEKIPAPQWKFPHPLKSYHDFLRERHGTIAQLAQAYGKTYSSFEEVRAPYAAFDRAEFLAQRSHWRWHFMTDNFVQVFSYIAVRGSALWNTFLLVGASLFGALTVSPMAAYALSRFRIKSKRMILIFLLVPMAFPGEVAQIPSFLLTRDLGLLNTYWALILPGIANGFSIFLLKGFFDGLPRELFEAAELDGASEWQIYWNITFPLCKPILALTSLGVVTAAYGGFMWAFIVCPDQKMWTLAVWVFQYSVDATQQGRAHLQMAALVLMSIPTLLIFLFTQKIIMKGIVVPTMK